MTPGERRRALDAMRALFVSHIRRERMATASEGHAGIMPNEAECPGDSGQGWPS
jgi:hypothetical protein